LTAPEALEKQGKEAKLRLEQDARGVGIFLGEKSFKKSSRPLWTVRKGVSLGIERETPWSQGKWGRPRGKKS